MPRSGQYTFYSDVPWVMIEDDDFPGTAWANYYADADGRLRIGTLVVTTDPRLIGLDHHHGGITGETLRAIAVADVERVINERRSEFARLVDVEPSWKGSGGPVHRLVQTLTRPKMAATKRRAQDGQFRLRHMPPEARLTDDYLRLVARAYYSAAEAGMAPSVAIAADVGYPLNDDGEQTGVRTIKSWVHKARQRGIMPPGRAGHVG